MNYQLKMSERTRKIKKENKKSSRGVVTQKAKQKKKRHS